MPPLAFHKEMRDGLGDYFQEPDSSPSMTPSETTSLLTASRSGDAIAADQLFTYLYTELRRLSQARLGEEGSAVTISATGLVHEVYLKLAGNSEWSDRTHLLALASRAMRQILTDRARARGTQKRGGKESPITLQADLVGAEETSHDLVLAIDAGLERLAARDADLARVFELRFFGGMEVADVASEMGVSPRTTARQWARAKAYLRADLN